MDNRGLIILARNGSSRLPRKSMLPLVGKPVLAHQIDRLKKSLRVRTPILATTILEEDNSLCDVASECGLDIFRGHPEDVVRRMVDAGERFALKFASIVGGDDVFCEGEFVDLVIAEHEKTGADFITIKDLPFGASPFGVSMSSLRKVLELKGDGITDGWERYLTDFNLFNTASLELGDPILRHPELRLDLDYPEDFKLVTAIYAKLYTPGQVPSLINVIRLLVEDEPELRLINRTAHEKWLNNRTRAQISLEFASRKSTT